MSAFSIAAAYDPHLPVGASRVAAVARISAWGVGERGVDASLRLWTPLGATIAILRELSPTIADLRGRAVRIDPRTAEFPAGRWTDGTRAYELAIAVRGCRAGAEMLAARLLVVADGQIVARARVAVAWTDDVQPIEPPAGSAAEHARMVAAAELPTGAVAPAAPHARRRTRRRAVPRLWPGPRRWAIASARLADASSRPAGCADRPSEAVRRHGAGRERRLCEPSALLALGQFGEAEAVEQDAQSGP